MTYSNTPWITGKMIVKNPQKRYKSNVLISSKENGFKFYKYSIAAAKQLYKCILYKLYFKVDSPLRRLVQVIP